MPPAVARYSTGRTIARVRALIQKRGVRALCTAALRRVAAARVHGRRWLLRDRAWIGRVLVNTGYRLRIEACRFSFGHPLITDQLRCRALLGRYERSERELLRRYLDRSLPVIELGGGLGVIACLTNRALRDPTQHVVVEANPSLIPVIERHRRWNSCQFVVVNAAIDHHDLPHANLQIQRDFISARVGSAEGVPVPALTLSQLLQSFPFPVCTLICDIEGAETELVEHEGSLLARRIAWLIVEIHPEFRSDIERTAMMRRLEAHGFSEVAQVRKVRVFKNVAHGGPVVCEPRQIPLSVR